MSQNKQNTQNLICKAGGTQLLAAGKQPFRIKFGMTVVPSQLLKEFC